MPAIPNPVAYACTPSSLLKSEPCIKCLSEKELWAAIVAILAISAGQTAKTAMNNAACFNCMSEQQMLQGVVTILGNQLLGAGTSPATVLASMNCLVCASESRLKAAALKLLCDTVTIT